MSQTTRANPASLLAKVEPRFAAPRPVEGLNLLEHGLLYVLTRHVSEAQAEQTVRAYKAAYADWNEPRVAQIKELCVHVKSKSAEVSANVARALKDYLQDIFQRNHGFDLEFVRDPAADGAKFVGELSVLGAAGGHYLLWLARSGQELPVTPGLVRTLDRLGLMARTQSLKKAAGLLDEARGDLEPLEFAGGFGIVVDRWCHARAPLCHECPLRDDCPHGRKAYKDWLAQQKRLEEQRRREAAREVLRLEKEAERRQKEEERSRKRREAEQQRLARERERKERALKRERENHERAAARAAAEKAKAEREAERAAKQAALERAHKEPKKDSRRDAGSKADSGKGGASARPAAKRPASSGAAKGSGSRSGTAKREPALSSTGKGAPKSGAAGASKPAPARKPTQTRPPTRRRHR